MNEFRRSSSNGMRITIGRPITGDGTESCGATEARRRYIVAMPTTLQQAVQPLSQSLYSPHVSYVDALRKADASAMVQVAGIVGFAVLTALGAQFRLAIWEVPF